MLGIVVNAQQAISAAVVHPDYLIHLSSVSAIFHHQKIESVCLVQTTTQCELVLAADNDDGTSHLFRLKLTTGR